MNKLEKSIDKFQLEIDKKYPKADIFINNAGVYHLPKSLSKDGYEIHFATNTLGNYYLAKKIIYDMKVNSKMIFVSSLAANFNSIDFKAGYNSPENSGIKISVNKDGKVLYQFEILLR